MAITTRTEIPAEINNFYVKNLLRNAWAKYMYAKWGQIDDIPSNFGTNVIKFRRYDKLTAATTALTEGTTPIGSQLGQTVITATALQYGDFVTTSDVVSFQSIDKVMMVTSKLQGKQIGDTIDQLTRAILVAGTNAYYGGTATSTGTVDTTDYLTTTMLDKVIALLDSNDADRIMEMVDPQTGYATSPIDESYICIISPNTAYTLRGLTGFVSVEKYAGMMKRLDGEVGAYKNIRFVQTSNGYVDSAAGKSANDVHYSLILGADAYGMTRISGNALEYVSKPLGSAGTADPINQRATVGWKMTYIAKILNDDFMCRLEHSVAV